MKKSELTRDLDAIAQSRIWEEFNTSLCNEENRRHTAFRRLKNPEAARLLLTSSMWTTVLAWHQNAKALTALYSYRGAYILFDRYCTDESGGVDVVIGVVAPTPEILAEALYVLEKSQQTQFDQPTLFGNFYE